MERDSEGKALTACNHCKQCKKVFITLADEKDDTCGGCHQENFMKENGLSSEDTDI